MKHFLELFHLKNLRGELQSILSRFPVSIGLILGACAIFLVLLHSNQSTSFMSDLWRVNLSLIITFFLSLGVYIFTESEGYNHFKRNLFQAFPLIFGLLFFLSFSSNIDDIENILRFIVSLFGILGFLFFAPYTKRLFKPTGLQDMYYSYFYSISVVFLLSAIFGVITLILGYIGITATITLFDINFSSMDKLFGDWAIFSLSFAAPLFALTQLPQKETFSKDVFQENVFFSFLTKFVALPFILVYFLILYAYSVKVLLNFGDWPKGEVAWLVIGFSTFGYIIYIFSYIFEKKIHVIEIFRKYFPYAVIPQTFMLFYAIYLRIAQYDLTSNRYFVVIFGIWLLLLSLHMIFSRYRFLAMIPAILTLFTIIISIGPWSVFSLPESRQLARLERNLEAAGILTNGTITPLSSYDEIDPELSGNIYSGISYVCGFSECDAIKKLFPLQYQKALADYIKEQETYNYDTEYRQRYPEPNEWQIANTISEEIKVRAYYRDSTGNSNQKYIYLYSDGKNGYFPLDVSSYDMLLDFSSTIGMQARVNGDAKTLTLTENEQVLESFDLSEFFQTLATQYTNNNNSNLSSVELSLTLEGQRYDIKAYFQNISILNPNYTGGDSSIYADRGAYGYVLVREK